VASTREQLSCGVRSQERYAPAFTLVLPVVKASLSYIQASNLAKWRQSASHEECRRVVRAMRSNCVLFKLGDDVFAIGTVVVEIGQIGIDPVHDRTGPLSASLQAGPSVEDNHDVFAERLRLYFLPFPQALSCGHHQHNRHDSPRN